MHTTDQNITFLPYFCYQILKAGIREKDVGINNKHNRLHIKFFFHMRLIFAIIFGGYNNIQLWRISFADSVANYPKFRSQNTKVAL
jgi:hypothetical protein